MAAQELRAGDVVTRVGARTDVGLKRRHNEDAVLALPAIYLVADGMGGYEAGDEASQAVAQAFREVVGERPSVELEDIRVALERADDAVAQVAAHTQRGAGSTVAGAAIVAGDEPTWVFFNVGDSRVYRHLGSVLQQITVDHSLGQELFALGTITAEELAVFPDRNVITRAIGAADAEADSWSMPVHTGDRILICSDGLTSEVPDEVIRVTLGAFEDPDEAAAALVDLARRAGGRDNISVVVVDVVAGGRAVDADRSDGDNETFLDETTVSSGSTS
jgi:serine/threonine protein phosphatase PrpC